MNRHALKELVGTMTAGPWRPVDDSAHLPGGFEPDRVVDAQGYTVAEATGDDDDLGWANNNGIAALRNCAPRLLELLEEAKNIARFTMTRVPMSVTGDWRIEEFLRAIDAPLDPPPTEEAA